MNLPSSSFAQPIAPPGRPSRSGQYMKVTVAPGLNVSPVMPRWIRPVGAEPSKLQSVSVPSGFFTLRYSHECGLLNAQRTTVPVFTICVAPSNIANEWCACTAVAVSRAAAAAAGSAEVNSLFIYLAPFLVVVVVAVGCALVVAVGP